MTLSYFILSEKKRIEATGIEIVKIEHFDIVKWEEELLQFDGGIFLLPKWVESLANRRNKPVYLDFKYEGNTVAKLSGHVFDGGKTRGSQLYFYTAPAFLNYSDQLYRDCLCALRNWSKSNGYTRISIDASDITRSKLVSVEGYVHTPCYEHVILLDGEWHPEHGSIKKNLSRSKKTNAVVKQSSDVELVEEMMELKHSIRDRRKSKYSEDFNDFHLRNFNTKVMKKLLQNQMAYIHYVELDGVMQCASYNLIHGTRCYGMMKGANAFAYKNGLQSLLDVSVIKIMQSQGVKCLNLSGDVMTSRAPGVDSYKLSLGAIEIHSAHLNTYYLTFPRKLLNPILYLALKFPNIRKTVLSLKNRKI